MVNVLQKDKKKLFKIQKVKILKIIKIRRFSST
jgi:hypothetical protein